MDCDNPGGTAGAGFLSASKSDECSAARGEARENNEAKGAEEEDSGDAFALASSALRIASNRVEGMEQAPELICYK